jgi:hypothetical protein
VFWGNPDIACHLAKVLGNGELQAAWNYGLLIAFSDRICYTRINPILIIQPGGVE